MKSAKGTVKERKHGAEISRAVGDSPEKDHERSLQAGNLEVRTEMPAKSCLVRSLVS